MSVLISAVAKRNASHLRSGAATAALRTRRSRCLSQADPTACHRQDWVQPSGCEREDPRLAARAGVRVVPAVPLRHRLCGRPGWPSCLR